MITLDEFLINETTIIEEVEGGDIIVDIDFDGKKEITVFIAVNIKAKQFSVNAPMREVKRIINITDMIIKQPSEYKTTKEKDTETEYPMISIKEKRIYYAALTYTVNKGDANAAFKTLQDGFKSYKIKIA